MDNLSAQQNQKWLKFDGISACIYVQADIGFLSAMPGVFSKWRYEILDAEPTEVFASIVQSNQKFTLSSPYMDMPESFGDPVNTLCRLVVELAWQQLRENPALLCLHGAAVEVNNRLVVFPSTRRAGKSTLCLGMIAAGMKLFTDDFLPVCITSNNIIAGISQGISPRLRLPIPDQVGPRTSAYIEGQGYISNKQYRYVVPKLGDAAANGSTSPIGALVFLERQDNAVPKLEKLNKSAALEALIKQNFSRAMNASAILLTLSDITRNTPAYTLTYDHVDPAVDVLKRFFDGWSEDAPIATTQDFSAAPVATCEADLQNWQTKPLTRMKGVGETVLEEGRFLSGDNNRKILRLNEGAACIWQLLEAPITLPEIVAVLSAAFPDEDSTQIEKDAEKTLGSFVQNQLVELVKINSDDRDTDSGYNTHMHNQATRLGQGELNEG